MCRRHESLNFQALDTALSTQRGTAYVTRHSARQLRHATDNDVLVSEFGKFFGNYGVVFSK